MTPLFFYCPLVHLVCDKVTEGSTSIVYRSMHLRTQAVALCWQIKLSRLRVLTPLGAAMI